MQKHFRALFAVLCLTSLSFSLKAQEPLDVFVLVGTSNMIGVAAKLTDLPAEYKKPNKNVLFFEGKEWLPLEPGKVPKEAKPVFGPYITFGTTMSKHLNRPVGIIKVKMTAVDDKQGYAKAVKIVKKAMATRKIVISGFVIQAGERDGTTEARAKAFKADMLDLIKKARSDFKNPDLPIVINRPIANPGKWKFVELVRKAEAELKAPGFKVIDCDDLPQVSDKIHYTAKGELEFGKRLAAGIIELSKK